MAQAGAETITASDRTRILVVDDEECIRSLFRAVITRFFPDLTCDVASDGKTALRLFGLAHHALVITDWRMPDMDGAAIFAGIQKTCRARSWAMSSVLFLGGFPPTDEIQALADLQGHGLLQKPISSQDLVQTVKQYVG